MREQIHGTEDSQYGDISEQVVKYDTPVYYQMKKHYGQKCMQDIEKLIKHHDFPEEGTLSLTKLKVVSTTRLLLQMC